ncbi:D-alanyl-D-alanine carboxypeptidase family protein [Actinomadura sp. HBU206391]|uniref:D-alanyl-D-alanine carboxypeptidase family protein n=1 Tax=Actinomadura sp. HBU206391 TaxID=2731692 RepID=UPI00164F569E|nr:D-alanyl-D-alanine carboxypeptidase family protein [Actinomadura sp. HBU206391]MBC6462548.1 D-alanyl-D-alanine carboxypeptidase family protein [Actinomadura sp. HBU206391]
MSSPRSGVLTAVFLAMALVALSGAPHAFVSPGIAAQRGSSDPVEVLHRQATKVRAELEKATKQWESRRKTLAVSQRKLQLTLRDLGQADAQLDAMRGPLAQLANAAYQQKGSGGTMAVFGGQAPVSGLRGAADVSYIASGQDTLVRQVSTLRQRREQLASTAQALQSGNAVEQAKLQQTVTALRQRSAQLTQQLTKTLDQMRASRDRRLALGCDRGLVADARKYPNGLIPARYLCALPQKGMKLRADSALAFYKLNSAYKARFNVDMCVRDAYRSLSSQQSVYYRRPGFAAVPGRSNHGLGTAVDLCGGVQNQGSLQFNWLRANSTKYGWFHPTWAYSSPFEPWHWEYDAKSD